MFGKDKSKELDDPVVSKSASKDIKTLIGEGCKVEGNFFIPTYTRVDGIIKGDLTGDSGIVIGVKGRVDGNIVASEIVNYGHIQGNVETQRLELKKNSSLNGDVTTNQFMTELGSFFNGKCTMVERIKNESSVTETSDNTPQ